MAETVNCFNENLRKLEKTIEDDALRLAVVGDQKVSVLNCIVQEFLFPSLPNHIVVELKHDKWPKICWFSSVGQSLHLNQILHLEDCASWKTLKRASYLKKTMGLVQSKTGQGVGIAKVEVHFPFKNPFPFPVVLSTSSVEGSAHLTFYTTSISQAADSELASLTMPTGTFQLDPLKTLMSLFAQTQSEHSQQFELIMLNMKIAVAQAEENRKNNLVQAQAVASDMKSALIKQKAEVEALLKHLDEIQGKIKDNLEPKKVPEMTREQNTYATVEHNNINFTNNTKENPYLSNPKSEWVPSNYSDWRPAEPTWTPPPPWVPSPVPEWQPPSPWKPEKPEWTMPFSLFQAICW